MCSKLVVNRGDIEIETVKQFREYFNTELKIPDYAIDVVDDDCCLCQIDVETALKQMNVPYVYDFCDYYIGTGLDEIEVP